MLKIYLAVILLCSTLYSFSQTTQSFQAVADNSMYAETPGNSNGIGENIFAGTTVFMDARRALIKFALPPGSGYLVTNVSLKLYCNKVNPTAPPSTVSVHKVTADWGEGTSDAAFNEGGGIAATTNDATWTNRFYNTVNWTDPGGDFVATASAGTTIGGAFNYYTWSSAQLIADVQSWINNPASNFGWLLKGDEGSGQSAKRFASRENPTAAFRPELTITYDVVPVKLMSFSASETAKGVALSWSTAQEVNNRYFSVEHSTDGIHFESIGRVNGMGNSSLTHHYQYTHTALQQGTHFYRLAQTDFDGKTNYSNTVTVQVKNRYSNRIEISQNPVADRLQILNNVAMAGNSYQLFSSTGAVVLKGIFFSNTVDIAKLPAGIYFIRINTKEGEQLTERFENNKKD